MIELLGWCPSVCPSQAPRLRQWLLRVGLAIAPYHTPLPEPSQSELPHVQVPIPHRTAHAGTGLGRSLETRGGV